MCTVTVRLCASCSTVGPMRHTRCAEFRSLVIGADFKHLRGNYDMLLKMYHIVYWGLFCVMLNESNTLWWRFKILRVLLQFSVPLILFFMLCFLCACLSLRTCNGRRGLQLLLSRNGCVTNKLLSLNCSKEVFTKTHAALTGLTSITFFLSKCSFGGE